MVMKKAGNKLVLEIDLTPEEVAPLSSTGKNKIAFTSKGFAYEQGLGVSLNIIHAKQR